MNKIDLYNNIAISIMKLSKLKAQDYNSNMNYYSYGDPVELHSEASLETTKEVSADSIVEVSAEDKYYDLLISIIEEKYQKKFCDLNEEEFEKIVIFITELRFTNSVINKILNEIKQTILTWNNYSETFNSRFFLASQDINALPDLIDFIITINPFQSNPEDNQNISKIIDKLFNNLRDGKYKNMCDVLLFIGNYLGNLAYQSDKFVDGIRNIMLLVYSLALQETVPDNKINELYFMLGQTYAFLNKNENAIRYFETLPEKFQYDNNRNVEYWKFTSYISYVFNSGDLSYLEKAYDILNIDKLYVEHLDIVIDSNTLGWLMLAYYLEEKHDIVLQIYDVKRSEISDDDFGVKWFVLSCLHMDKFERAFEVIESMSNESFSSSKALPNKLVYNWFSLLRPLLNKHEGYKKNIAKIWLYAFEIFNASLLNTEKDFYLQYYTSLSSLNETIKDRNEKDSGYPIRQYRFPIFEIKHMNDPEEGKILMQKLDIRQEQSILIADFIFIKSFMYSLANDDVLEMWAKYGNNGGGCCVILNNDTFRKDFDEEAINSNNVYDDDIYHLLGVNYISSSGYIKGIGKNQIRVQKLVRLLKASLKSLKNRCSKSAFDQIANAILVRIKCLFKDWHYSKENEVRLLIFRTEKHKHKAVSEISLPNFPFPKICIFLEGPIQINSVILGPKVSFEDECIPFIQKQLEKINLPGIEATIKKSSIPYR